MIKLNNPLKLDVSNLSPRQIKYLTLHNIEIKTIDENGNINCYHCIDCDNCTDCGFCDDSYHCGDCDDCTFCDDCINKENK